MYNDLAKAIEALEQKKKTKPRERETGRAAGAERRHQHRDNPTRRTEEREARRQHRTGGERAHKNQRGCSRALTSRFCLGMVHHGRVPAAALHPNSYCTARSHWDEGACYALWASRCDLRDPGWGDPGFSQRDVLFFVSSPGSCKVMCWVCVCFTQGLIFSTQAAVIRRELICLSAILHW